MEKIDKKCTSGNTCIGAVSSHGHWDCDLHGCFRDFQATIFQKTDQTPATSTTITGESDHYEQPQTS